MLVKYGFLWYTASCRHLKTKTDCIPNKGEGLMGPFEYVVAQIDGDYAHLRRIDAPEGEELLVARALLPFETDEGSRLRYEYGSYTLL